MIWDDQNCNGMQEIGGFQASVLTMQINLTYIVKARSRYRQCVRSTRWNHRQPGTRNIFQSCCLTESWGQIESRDMEPTDRIPYHIDHKTARSICDEVGDRLQQDLSLETSPLPPYLARLINELRQQERRPIDGVES